MDNTGAHIKAFRKKHNISQAEFAEYFPDCKMKQEHVSFYEKGRRSVPPEIMEVMLKAGVIPDELTGASNRVKRLMDNMKYEDQTMVEQFVRRLMQ